mmetsp:Transcript_168894/g.542903  ORF Transcript_168894/g.542903 Transcript_168894/m.542903 type:complete len:233 (+) Transcript_168894:862-1560(+)
MPGTSARRRSNLATARPSIRRSCGPSRSSWKNAASSSHGKRATSCSSTIRWSCTPATPSSLRAASSPRSAACRCLKLPSPSPPLSPSLSPPWRREAPGLFGSASSARAPWARSTSATSRCLASMWPLSPPSRTQRRTPGPRRSRTWRRTGGSTAKSSSSTQTCWLPTRWMPSWSARRTTSTLRCCARPSRLASTSCARSPSVPMSRTASRWSGCSRRTPTAHGPRASGRASS